MTQIERMTTRTGNTRNAGRLLTSMIVLASLAIPGASAVFAQGSRDNSGFLYGKVTTKGGSEFVGRLRWGTEEASWGDFFNSSKTDRGIPDEAKRNVRREKREEGIRIFGYRIGIRSKDVAENRLFKARFGDIDTIEPRGKDRARVTMRSGEVFNIDGGSNDIGATINIWDESVGRAEVKWTTIRRIEFMDTPRNLDVGNVFRLHGRVHTVLGDFEGFIQWDQDECLSIDKLDGETSEADLSLRMGRLRSIERRSSRSSKVVLDDGREFVLDDSNDVDSGNRGIYVDDKRYGRVLVQWDAFRKVDFTKPKNSGPSYSKYDNQRELRGKVFLADGTTAEGRIHYDLDEASSWEILDGNRQDVEYSIPFALIAKITPDISGSKITLRSGEELTLEDAVDVGKGNDGLLVVNDRGRMTYVRWDDLDWVEFTR